MASARSAPGASSPSAFRLSQSLISKSSGANRMFQSPHAAGRRITMGFSWMQRLGKGAAIDVWFPAALKEKLQTLLASGASLSDENFPAEWAAVRQFELLQDAGNYKIYNMQADYLMRSLYELNRSMRGGGYRIVLATLGGYCADSDRDDLQILDERLQKRLSQIIHMLYLDEQSAEINQENDADLAAGRWDFRTALPHVGMTLGARDLYRPVGGGVRPVTETFVVPTAPHRVALTNWVANLGVSDAMTGDPLRYKEKSPEQGEYSFQNGVYTFSPADEMRLVDISFLRSPPDQGAGRNRTMSEKRHLLARQFFNILNALPHRHIAHDTAVGLQLPEMINENEWLYIPESDESLHAFNCLLRDVFAPLDILSLSTLDGRDDAGPEIKSTVQHMRGYGDRLTPDAEAFQRQMAQFNFC